MSSPDPSRTARVIRTFLFKLLQQDVDTERLDALEEMSRLDQELGLVLPTAIESVGHSVIDESGASADMDILEKDMANASIAFSDVFSIGPPKFATQSSPAWVRIERNRLLLGLVDSSWVSCPLWWFPRLKRASDEERNASVLSSAGIHWPAIDEHLSAERLFQGYGDLSVSSDLRERLLSILDPDIVGLKRLGNAAGVLLSDGRCLGVSLCAEST